MKKTETNNKYLSSIAAVIDAYNEQLKADYANAEYPVEDETEISEALMTLYKIRKTLEKA